MKQESFTAKPPDTILVEHNVAGPEGVLTGVNPKLAEQVNNHYSSRALEQAIVPPKEGVIYVANLNDPEQTQYRQDLIRRRTPQEIVISKPPSTPQPNTLYVPYIRIKNNQERIGQIYGLPPYITSMLKNKGEFHRLCFNNEQLQPHTPNFVTVPVSELLTRGQRMLQQIQRMYEDLNVTNYPPGLMIRAVNGDGGYGGGFLYRTSNRQWAFVPDGDATKKTAFGGNLTEILQQAQQHIVTSSRDRDPQVIITRFLNIEVSPGMSAAIADNQIYVLDFNGQWQEKGSSACVGTCSLNLLSSAHQRLLQSYQQQARKIVKLIVKQLMFGLQQSHDPKLYGIFNVDFMVPGQKEHQLWKAARKANKYLKPSCNDQWMPRAYPQNLLLLAELNPRFTNWSLAVTAVSQLTQWTGNPTDWVHTSKTQILALDRYPLTSNNMTKVRDTMTQLDEKLANRGGGVILRMPDNPAGVIVWAYNNADISPQQILSMLSTL